MPYLRCLLVFATLMITGFSANETNGATGDCPVLDASNAAERDALMHYVCFVAAGPGDEAHSVADPSELPGNQQWTPANGHDLIFSQTDSVYWVQLKVSNLSDARQFWYLKLNYPLLDQIGFWISGNSADQQIMTGDQHPFASRGIDYRYYLFPVTLNAGENATVTLRIQSSGALNVPLSLSTPDVIIADSNHLTLAHGLFYGALAIFAIFNLLLYFSSGTIYYFHNAFYMASLAMFLFAMGGFANQYFWPNSTGFANTSIPLLIAVCTLAITLFGRSFLDISPDTFADRLLKAQAWLSGALALLAFVLPYSLSIIINAIVGLSSIASLFITGFIRWREGYMPAKWYVLAWSGMLAGTLIYTLAAFGYLTDFLAREIFMQVAVGTQVLLLNYAIVQRWRLLNQKLLDIEHDARIQLEQKVHERTSQLRSTMRELEQANRQLAAMSLNDSLTGLHNRRHMDNLLPELCAESRRTGQPLTLALLDADHFKSVNDRWGHDFGDTCLKHIAEILSRHVKRPRDVAIRFGGEEFALLLPGTEAAGALRLCQRILEDMQQSVVKTATDGPVTITMSAGTATLLQNEDDRELFRRADEALYRAKVGGRNQIIQAVEPD
ncbi:sensor domain-containing diguanylate cyclase [Marinobacter confluentis]|uniref:diguanylate cyclase n=1 Tax=Marinobacter confluentis TaxID=1697557 RepID=A0A4Z1C4U8_9GAMM|nr:diguanylate cyclase [Marinobacter confluentis]TGN41411.1 GGDEF domain-containing protein [Marinobacter confluentis]